MNLQKRQKILRTPPLILPKKPMEMKLKLNLNS